MNIPVRISNDSPLGCIIGIDTIKQFNIVQIVPHFFLSEKAIEVLRSTLGLRPHNNKRKAISITAVENQPVNPPPACRIHKCTAECRGCTSDGVAQLPDIVVPVQDDTTNVIDAPQQRLTRNVRFDDTPLESSVGVINLPATVPALTQTPRPVSALLRENEQLTEVTDFGDEDIDHDRKDTFAPFRNNNTISTDTLDKITICGTPEQQNRIRMLCVKYKQIFKGDLDANPANILPFDLIVDL